MWNVLGVLCYIFAVVDLVAFYIFDTDITGFSFSPMVAGGLGYIFQKIGDDD